jgi:hypothetical protein
MATQAFHILSIRSGRRFCVQARDEADLARVLRQFYACTQYQVIK